MVFEAVLYSQGLLPCVIAIVIDLKGIRSRKVVVGYPRQRADWLRRVSQKNWNVEGETSQFFEPYRWNNNL